jgi:hypothetical protein
MPMESIAVHRSRSEQILMQCAPGAAKYLRTVALVGKEKRNSLRVDTCKFIINHALGLPKAKIEHSGIANEERELAEFNLDELKTMLAIAEVKNGERVLERANLKERNARPRAVKGHAHVTDADSSVNIQADTATIDDDNDNESMPITTELIDAWEIAQIDNKRANVKRAAKNCNDVETIGDINS